MGFFSFLGRVLFASLFILSAWQMFNEFGDDGGPVVSEFAPKLNVLNEHLAAKLGVVAPDIDGCHLAATIIALKGVGGILFVFGRSFGAYLLLTYLAFTTPLLYDFYNYNPGKPEFVTLLNDFMQSLALCGALLYFMGMKNSIRTRQIKKKTPKTKTV